VGVVAVDPEGEVAEQLFLGYGERAAVDEFVEVGRESLLKSLF
jgi:hypothetical protein